MPKIQKHSQNGPETIPSAPVQSSLLTKREKIIGYLQHLALPSVFNRELTEADYDVWDKLLAPYPEAAIDYAFDNWGRNGKFFPRPSSILELIGAWKLSNQSVEFKPCGLNGCEEGWVRVFEGRTDGGHTVDPKTGAVKRCQCFIDWCEKKKAAA
jgi:hypothetical protein